MKNTLFDKAKKLIPFLIKEGTGLYEEYWKFKFPESDDIPIRFILTKHGTFIRCTCKACTKNEEMDKPEMLCSFKLALILKRAEV